MIHSCSCGYTDMNVLVILYVCYISVYIHIYIYLVSMYVTPLVTRFGYGHGSKHPWICHVFIPTVPTRYGYLHQARKTSLHESDECFKDFRVTFNGNSSVAVIRTFVSVSGGVLEATSLL